MMLFEHYPIRPSNLTLYDLVRRIAKYSEIPKSVFVVGILYIDKLLAECRRTKNRFYLTKTNVNNVTLVAMMIAQKYFIDTPLDNKSWAWIGNIPLAHLNEYETMFLRINQFRLSIGMEDIQRSKLLRVVRSDGSV